MTTRRGYLYVPAGKPNDAVLAYAVEHVTIAIPSVQPAAFRGGRPTDERARRARLVLTLAEAAPAPGLYHVRIVADPMRATAEDRWRLVRGPRAGSPLDEIRKLQATARSRPEGKRPNPKALRAARRSRALADAMRRFILPAHAGEVAVEVAS